MTTSLNLFRSALYVPCSNSRAIEKVKQIESDVIIFDLEDSILPEKKIHSRKKIFEILANDKNLFPGKFLVVRVNGLNTEWGIDDLELIYKCKPDAILIPKIENEEDLRYLKQNFMDINESTIKFWAMIETPLSIINLEKLASHKFKFQGFVMGTNDLLQSMGLKGSKTRDELIYALSKVTMISKAYNLIVLDGVFNNFRNAQGLKKECIQGKNLGFNGKTLIHPSQIEITNSIFSPSTEEIDEAYAIIKSFNETIKKGSGVAVYKGSIVEDLHVRAAKELISFDKKIRKNF